MKNSLAIIISILFASFMASAAHADTDLAKPAYKATFNDDGLLTGISIGDMNILSGPVELSPGTKWTGKFTQEKPGAEASATLTGPKGESKIDYRVADNQIMLSLTNGLKGDASWRINFSPNVIAVESLQNTNVSGSDAIQYVDHGDIHPTPLVPESRIQKARLYLKNGATVLFWHEGWGAKFNLDEMGAFKDYTYDRNQLATGKPMPVFFQIENPAGKPAAIGPAYTVTGNAFGNLFYAVQPLSFSLHFSDATADRLKSQPNWQIHWTLTDFREAQASGGDITIPGPETAEKKIAVLELPSQMPGWYALHVSLTSPPTAAAPANQPEQLPSQFTTMLGVVHDRPDFAQRPALDSDDAKHPDDYLWSAMLGLKCVRESHGMQGLFPDKEKRDWKQLDEIMDHASAQAAKYHITWFFQANEKPNWADPADYQSLAAEMVTRYKDRCKIWEVENEPNFRYGAHPEDYVNNVLIPFSKGAKSADPSAQILAPACVSVPHSIAFLQKIKDLNALASIDAVSTHTYIGPGEPWELFGNNNYLHVLHVIAPEKPLWQTEQGYNWGMDGRQVQARFAVRQFLNGLADGISVDHHMYFYLTHHGFEPWYIVENNFNGQQTPEPAAIALRAMNEQIAGKTAGEMTSPSFGVYMLPFTGEKEDVYAMWTLDFSVSVIAHGPHGVIFDFMGKPMPVLATEEMSTFGFDGYPIYLHMPHGGKLNLDFQHNLGLNIATAEQGAVITASSSVPEKAAENGHPAQKAQPPENAIDGRWQNRDAAPDCPQRTEWEAADSGASVDHPQWLALDFGKIRKPDSAVFIFPVTAVDATPRDFSIQVSDDGTTWKTVAEVKDNINWIVKIGWAAAETRHWRMLITKLNDGWHKDGKFVYMIRQDITHYTNMQAKVIELMVYESPNNSP